MKLHSRILSTFQEGFKAAQDAGVIEPSAMTLATRSEHGDGVAARTVLLKDVDEDGFVFFTNTQSHKGRQLAHCPRAALLFLWRDIERQVQVEGVVKPVNDAEADAYFASRPRGSQIGAWASMQSRPLDQRSTLEARVKALEEQYEGQSIPRPSHWSGYRLMPHMVEFWYGRPYRLHDRFRWTIENGEWVETRLYP